MFSPSFLCCQTEYHHPSARPYGDHHPPVCARGAKKIQNKSRNNNYMLKAKDAGLCVQTLLSWKQNQLAAFLLSLDMDTSSEFSAIRPKLQHTGSFQHRPQWVKQSEPFPGRSHTHGGTCRNSSCLPLSMRSTPWPCSGSGLVHCRGAAASPGACCHDSPTQYLNVPPLQ